MKNREKLFWGLIQDAPFLKNYLTEIESKGEPENVVEELVAFYKDVDVLIDEVLTEVPKLITPVSRYSSFVIRHSEVLSNK